MNDEPTPQTLDELEAGLRRWRDEKAERLLAAEGQEQLDLRFAAHIRAWRRKRVRHYIGSDEIITMLEVLWDHTLETQGRTQADLSGRVLGFLKEPVTNE